MQFVCIMCSVALFACCLRTAITNIAFSSSGGNCFAFAIDKRTGEEVWRRSTGQPGAGGTF